MSEPIKVQILQGILTRLQDAKTNLLPGDIDAPRKVEMTFDLATQLKQLPNWQLYHEDETEVPTLKDTRGRTYDFPIAIKVSVQAPHDLALAVERHVAEVQRIMESDIQLAGLVSIIDNGGVQLALGTGDQPVGVAILTYTVRYRRALGNPYATY